MEGRVTNSTTQDKVSMELEMSRQRCVMLQKEVDESREQLARFKSDIRELDEMYQKRLQKQADRLVKSQREIDRISRLRNEARTSCPSCGVEFDKLADYGLNHADAENDGKSKDKMVLRGRPSGGGLGSSFESMSSELNKENTARRNSDAHKLLQRIEKLEKERAMLQEELQVASKGAEKAMESTTVLSGELSTMKKLVKELSVANMEVS